MVFLETSVFVKLIDEFLSDDERFKMFNHLLEAPDSGDLIPQRQSYGSKTRLHGIA